MMSEKKFKVGDRVSLKQAVDVHIDGGLTQICPGEVGIIDWTNGEDMEVYFGDFIKLELNVSQDEPAEPTDPRTAFLQELRELLMKYNAKIYSTDFSSYMSAEVNGEGVYFLNSELAADNIMDYEK